MLVYAGYKLVKARKEQKEKARGNIKVGDSDIARKAFADEKGLPAPPPDTIIQYEDPTAITARSPESQAAAPDLEDVASPSSEKGDMALTHTETASSEYSQSVRSARSSISHRGPPPYSAAASSTTTLLSPATKSPTSNYAPSIGGSSTSSTSHGIRVKTNGSDLKSGFPYHPALFDVQVHPSEWQKFTDTIVKATKFDIGDHAAVWAAATATALTGAFGTSVWVGKTMNKKVQEKKITEGLGNQDEGGLGATLEDWNASYFREHGLFVHLELSESSLRHKEKNKDKKIKMPHHGRLFHFDKEERERKREERKFVIVVTKLDEDGMPAQAVNEIQELDGGAVVHEMASHTDAKYSIAELPGEDGPGPVELPAELPASAYTPTYFSTYKGGVNEKEVPPPPEGIAELDSGLSDEMERTKLAASNVPLSAATDGTVSTWDGGTFSDDGIVSPNTAETVERPAPLKIIREEISSPKTFGDMGF